MRRGRSQGKPGGGVKGSQGVESREARGWSQGKPGGGVKGSQGVESRG